MSITNNSKIVILPEDFQEKRSLAPGAQIMTVGELRNMFVKPFNWNASHADTLPMDVTPLIDYYNLVGNLVNCNLLDVNGNVASDSRLDLLNIYNDWSGSIFSGTLPSQLNIFFRCNLNNVSFDSCTLSQTPSFSECSMIGVSFGSANIGDSADQVPIIDCDLTNADFRDVSFNPSVLFTNCKMDGVNLKGATLPGPADAQIFVNCTGLPDNPKDMGFSIGTGFLYWEKTGTYFNESFDEYFCKTIAVDGVRFAGQNLVGKVFGFYDAGSIVPTALRNCDFSDAFITMDLSVSSALFENCNFYGAQGLSGTPDDYSMQGEIDGSSIRWIDGAYWVWSAGDGQWNKQ